MNKHDELPDGKKLPWPHSQTDFVTHVLALAGHLPNEDDMDALGERMLNMVDLDPSPFPDFQSMRLALQHGCDVATYEASLNDNLQQYAGAIMTLREAGISYPKREAGAPQGGEASLEQWQFIMDLNAELSLGATGGPPVQFAKMPAPGAKLCWNASLHDFVALVVATDEHGITPNDLGEDRLALIAEHYRSVIDVDYHGYTDFHALRQAYPEKINYKANIKKLFRVHKAHGILRDAGPLIAMKRFPGFSVQARYHTIVAEDLSKHWPAVDEIKLVYLLDVLFLPTKFVKAVLKHEVAHGSA